MITKYRCDEPMAKRWGIYGRCDKKCKNCLCAIGMDEWGKESHVMDMAKGTSANITVRNTIAMNGRFIYD